MSCQPRRSAYRAADRVTVDTVRAPPSARDAEQAVAPLLAAGPPAPPPLHPFQPPHPQAQAQAQAPEREGERVQVSLAQVPRWQGSEATHNRRDRRHYGGNECGCERRLLREFAEPAAAAAAADGAAPPPMLRESSNGEDGAAPRRRPWPGREGPPRQRRRVAVMSPPAPPSRAPSAAGYAADKSSVRGVRCGRTSSARDRRERCGKGRGSPLRVGHEVRLRLDRPALCVLERRASGL